MLNSVNPDQLASQKPADQDPHCFSLFLKTCKYRGVKSIKMGKSVVFKHTQHGKGYLTGLFNLLITLFQNDRLFVM